MLAGWDEIWAEVFKGQYASLPSASEAEAELEDMWQRQPARLLRKMYSGGPPSGLIEESADDDDAVAALIQELDVRSMFSQPKWVQRQLFLFIVVLNELHKFRKYHLVESEAFERREHLVDADYATLAKARDDIATLVDVLVQPGGIELIRHKPFSIAGPGAHQLDFERLYDAYFEPHEDFFKTRARKALGAWLHLDSVLRHYYDALENAQPSRFLALTSASLERRWLSNYLSEHERPQQQHLSQVNNRVEVPRRLVNDGGLFTGYIDAARATLNHMNGDIYDQDLSEYGDLTLPLIKSSILAAGMKIPRTFELPPNFETYEDDYEDEKFFKQVIRHGGCPKRHLSGLNSGALKGAGWISLPSILQDGMETYFWNSDGEWLWHEDGKGSRQPEPNIGLMKALVNEIGEVPIFDKDAPYDNPDERDDDEGGPSMSGTSFSGVTGLSATGITGSSATGVTGSTVTDSAVSYSESDDASTMRHR